MPATLLRLLALAGLTALLSGCDQTEGAAQAQGGAPPPPPVIVASPLVRQIVDWDEYSGHFQAVQTVEVRPRVTGYLQSVDFSDGQIVRAGQVLFRIDPRPFQAELAKARAEEQRARADLTLARRQLERTRQLLKRGFVTRSEADEREAAVLTAEAAVAAAQASIRARALDIEYAVVRAPISGRVSDGRVDRGNLVTGSGQGEATLLTTIMSVDPIHFEFSGSEAVYLKYQRQNEAGTRTSSRYASNPVEIRLQDDPSYAIRGRMDFVDNSLDTGSGTIRGRALVSNPNGFLTPGMFGRMRLLGSGAYSALLVPDSSIVTDQTRKLVMTLAVNNSVVPKPVEIGPLVDGLRIVRTGLAPTDRVIISGLQRVRPGDKAVARPGRIVAPAPGSSPQPQQAYSAPPAAAASAAGASR